MTDNRTLEAEFDFHGGALDDIFSTYSRLRAKCPVGRSGKYGGFWYLTKNEDIFAAEQDPGTFSVAPSMLLPDFGTGFPLIPIDIDPPEHAWYRRILLPLFTPRAVARLEDGMRGTARQLIGQMKEQRVADVSALYARPMPTVVFSRLAGFPEKDWPKFDAWVDDIIYERTTNPARARAAAREVVAYFDHLLQARTSVADNRDLISELLGARIDGEPLTHDELVSYCYLLFLAGLDTTAWAIRSSLWYLARHAEAQERLRREPDLIPAAAEEFLRTMSPVQAMARTCRADTEIRGRQLKAGDRVLLVFGAGNRDPDGFERPDEIQIDRDANRHLAFGAGIHRCLGSHLGRRELVVALQEFLSAMPGFSHAKPDEKWHGIGRLTLSLARAKPGCPIG
jgi:cytochrome P450